MGEEKVEMPGWVKVLDGMEWSINHFAGESIRKKVMQRLDGVSSKPPLSSALLQEIAKYNSDREVARWVKGGWKDLTH